MSRDEPEIGLLIPIHSHLTTSSSILNIVSGSLALLLVIWEWYGRRGSPNGHFPTAI
jgi:hypothetical protein